MDLSLTEEQKMLKISASDFLLNNCPKKLVREMEKDELGYPPKLWNQIAELGWMGLILPHEYGGADMSFLDLLVLLKEMGRACLPAPFFSTVLLGALPILYLGSDEQKKKYLPQIAAGKAIFTMSLLEVDASYNANAIKVRANPEDDTYIIDGTKLFVPDAHVAEYILCVTRTGERTKDKDGITIFMVNAKSPGITVTVLKTTAGDKLCEVNFERVSVSETDILGKVNKGWSDVQKIMQWASVAKCAEMVGGMEAVLEMTVEYCKQRKQFDHPIGSFQAIQHHCANMLADVDSSNIITNEAAWRISRGLPCEHTTAMAKNWVSSAYRRVAFTAQQVHGGVGITEDYDLSLYFRRAKAAELSFGDSRFHRDTISRRLGFGEIVGFETDWPES